ncbi:MAG: NTP transferase domain-containing protein, partial [Nitrososphaerota archaeon]
MSKPLYVTILAGGLGRRMNSELPKVLLMVKGETMITRIVRQAIQLEPDKILIVVGKYRSMIMDEIEKKIGRIDIIEYVYQEFPLGTGDA